MNRKQRRAKAHEYKDQLDLMKKRKKRQEEALKFSKNIPPVIGSEEYFKAYSERMKEYMEAKGITYEEQKPSAFVDPVWQKNFGDKLKQFAEKKVIRPITEQEFFDAADQYRKEGLK